MIKAGFGVGRLDETLKLKLALRQELVLVYSALGFMQPELERAAALRHPFPSSGSGTQD